MAKQDNPVATRTAVSAVRKTIPEEVRTTNPKETSVGGYSREYRRYQQIARRTDGDDLLDAENADDIIIPNNLQEMCIFDGHQNGDRMLVFLSGFGRQLLRQYGENICIDGTFKANNIFR